MYTVDGCVFVSTESTLMTVLVTFMARYEHQILGVNMTKSTVMTLEEMKFNCIVQREKSRVK